MGEEITFRVNAGASGERLDVFLARHLTQHTRSQLKQWIQAGAAEVDGARKKAGYRLAAGEQIRVRFPEPRPTALAAEPLELDILYEDEALLAVNKPAGMVVHPGAGNPTGTLANALLYHFQNLAELDPLRPGIVHRLDKETSGVLVVAKSRRAQELLAAQFRRREVDKCYLALVFGQTKRKSETIDLPIGRHPRQRTRISTRSHKLRSARTSYRVIRWFEEFSLLEVRLYTGRTHQIRVHLRHLNHPVVGDAVYSSGRLNHVRDSGVRSRINALDRHFLHAWKLVVRHPFGGQTLNFRAPLPRNLVRLLRAL